MDAQLFLARAGFALDQDGDVAIDHAGELVEQLSQPGIAGRQRTQACWQFAPRCVAWEAGASLGAGGRP